MNILDIDVDISDIEADHVKRVRQDGLEIDEQVEEEY